MYSFIGVHELRCSGVQMHARLDEQVIMCAGVQQYRLEHRIAYAQVSGVLCGNKVSGVLYLCCIVWYSVTLYGRGLESGVQCYTV